MVCTKSPLTGTITCASLGGDFAARLKSCGYDGLILRGRSPRPVIVDITEGRWKIRDAGKLWGQNVVRTQELLESRVASILCIGPAGENLVSYATVSRASTPRRGAATGAVLGSKLVKALRVGGSFETTVFDKDRLTARSSCFGRSSKPAIPTRRYGTAGNLTTSQEKGVLPTRNFTCGTFDRHVKISGEALRSQIRRKGKDCPGCPVDCTTEMKLATRTGTIRVKGPGYQPLVMLGSNLMIDDLETDNPQQLPVLPAGNGPHKHSAGPSRWRWSSRRRAACTCRSGSAARGRSGLSFRSSRTARGPGDELADGAARLVDNYGYSDLAMAVKGYGAPRLRPAGLLGSGPRVRDLPGRRQPHRSMMVARRGAGKPVDIPGPTGDGQGPAHYLLAEHVQRAGLPRIACNRATYCTLVVPAWVRGLPGWVARVLRGQNTWFRGVNDRPSRLLPGGLFRDRGQVQQAYTAEGRRAHLQPGEALQPA